MSLQIVLLTGLLAAVLLFAGDMILYYHKDDYIADGTLKPLIGIMKKENRLRLYVGGLIGPIAAFLYCVGFYHLVLFVNQQYVQFGWISFLINCLAIILGGAYHCYFANLGLIARHDDKAALDEILKFLNIQKNIAFGLQAIGFLTMALLIALGWTALPRWMALFTPLTLVLLTPLMDKLPRGFHIIIYGGWTNLISVIYYAMAVVVLLF